MDILKKQLAIIKHFELRNIQLSTKQLDKHSPASQHGTGDILSTKQPVSLQSQKS